MKKVDKDPFSNGTEHMRFETYNCDRCIKSSELKKDGTYSNCDADNMPKCSIQRDIVKKMFFNVPIKEETVKICNEFSLYGVLCPYLKTEYPKKKAKQDNNQTKLEL